MLLQSIGAALPAALAVALSPFPVIGVVLITSGVHGRRNGPVFAVGWIVGLTAVATLAVLVLGGADDPNSTSSAVADWARVLAGAALIVLGVRKWLARPRAGEEVGVPGWMSSLDHATTGRTLGLGFLLSAANPKNFVLTAAATTSMIEAGAQGAELILAVACFVIAGSITVAGTVVVRLVGGPRGAEFLDSVRQFMADNSTVITVLVLVLLGAKILGDGLAGLGR